MRTSLIHRDLNAYSSHPCVALLHDGTWLVAFSSSPKHDPVRHPPDHPLAWNVVTRSEDQGASWTTPEVVPDYDWFGVETPGITQISTGDVLLNQWRFRWHPWHLAREVHRSGGTEIFVYDQGGTKWRPVVSESDWTSHPFAFVRADDGAYVHMSSDGGRTFDRTVRLDISPYRGAFSPKGCIELGNGDLLLGLGSHDYDPRAACFVVRSKDHGKTWSKPTEVARKEGRVFSEPSVCATRSGKLVMHSREEVAGMIYQSESSDDGYTWSDAQQLPIWGYPSHCIALHDGRLMLVYGRRKHPFGIRASISRDEGLTWGQEAVIRGNLSGAYEGWNLGYPSAIEYEPGRVFVVYYGEDANGTTCVQGSYVAI